MIFCHLPYRKVITESYFFVIKVNIYYFLTFNSNLHMVMFSSSGACFPEQFYTKIEGVNMIKMRKKPLGLCMLIIVGLAFVFSPMSLYAWKPKKPIEFVIMAGKGGGADKMARLMPVSYTHLTLPTILLV